MRAGAGAGVVERVDGEAEEAHQGQHRNNGGKATNKGKVTSAKVPVIVVQNADPSLRSSISFEKVFRAKLPKNAKYFDEVYAEDLAARASQAVRDAEICGNGKGKVPCIEPETARGILDAYKAATDVTK